MDQTAAPAPKPILCYILGLGRSGSTLVAEALGQRSGAIALGEMPWFWQRGAVENWRCTSGLAFADHPVWQDVLASSLRQLGDPPATHMAKACAAMRRRRHRLAWLPTLGTTHTARQYRRGFEAVYTALAQRTGCPVLIDSGKVPFHAALMLPSDRVDVRLLHLSRDPRGVVFSRQQAKPLDRAPGAGRSTARANGAYTTARWIGQTLACLHLTRRAKWTTRLDYDAFCADPDGQLHRVIAALGLPLGAVRSLPADLSGLAFSGNPGRTETLPKIPRDTRFLAAMPAWQRVGIELTAGQLYRALRQ